MDSNWGSSTYQPNTLPLGQTGFQASGVYMHVCTCYSVVLSRLLKELLNFLEIEDF